MNLPARNTDPETSHEAARHMVDSGARRAQQQRVAAAVRKHPGLTSRELAEVAGMDRHMVARRLPELEGDGIVVHGAPRKCRISEMRCQTWLPVLEDNETPLAA